MVTEIIKTSFCAITFSVAASVSHTSITVNSVGFNSELSSGYYNKMKPIVIRRKNDGLPEGIKFEIEQDTITPANYIIHKSNLNSSLLTKVRKLIENQSNKLQDVLKSKLFLREISNFLSVNNIELSKLTGSITTSESIFFRLNLLNSDYEFRFECFFEKDEEDDIEAISHIYKNNKKIISQFGSFKELLGTVSRINEGPISIDSINRNYIS